MIGTPTVNSAGEVAVQFSEDLDQSNLPAASAFTGTADGTAFTVTDIVTFTALQGDLYLTVSPVLRPGQRVVLTYTDPTGGNDPNAVQDAAGNDAASFTTGLGGVLGVINAPSAPISLTATASGTSRIDLSWNAPSYNGGRAIASYKIEISSDGGSIWTDHVANTRSTATTYAHIGLAAGTTRHYRVSARNFLATLFTSIPSNIDSATTAGVTISETSLTVTEEDTTGDTYTVVLNTQPTANVTVTVAGHSGTEVTPTPASLTFTTTNWSTAQTVTVTAATDTDTTNDMVTLTHSAASTDPDYSGITIGSVVVTVEDNDTDGVTISETSLTVTEEDTTGDTYTVVLDTPPTADVMVTVAGHARTVVTPTPASLTFTSTTWSTAQTVTVTARNDADTINDTVTLTHRATSTDSNYSGITIDSVVVTVEDNDTAPSGNVLVSNVGQTTIFSSPLSNDDLAQSFTVTNDTSYTLSSIELKLNSSGNSSTNTPTVRLYSGSANGTLVSTFTGPAMLDTNTTKNYTFTPSSTVTLRPDYLSMSTTYWVVAEGDTRWSYTSSDSEDGTSAMGWGIADDYEFRTANSTGNFRINSGTTGVSLQIRVNGTVIPDTTPPEVVSATVNADGDQVQLVFSEDLVIPASGVVAFLNTLAGSFSVTAAGSPLSIGRVSVTAGNAPHILTLPVSPDIGQGQAVVLSYTDPTAGDDDVALEDALGHETPSFTTGMSGVPAVTNNSTVDLTGPALVSATVNADGDQVQLVFSEDLVIPASGVVAFLNTLAGSFSVTAAGSPLSIGRVSVTAGNAPHILTLPVSPDIGQGQAVVLSYTDPTAGDDDVALEDALGHETPSFTTGMSGVPAVTNNSTVDLTGPALVSATVNADGDQVELVFSEDLVLPASGLVAFLDTLAGSFSVTAAGSPLSIGRVSVTAGNAPHILTLPVSPDIGQGQAVVLSYTDPTAGDDDVALEDALGHETPSFTTGMSGVPAVTNNSEVVVTAAGVTVSTMALTVTEEDTTGDTYTVVLDTQPTADVTVTVAGHSGTEVTPTPASLTFTSTTWSTAQTVTVTAGNDADLTNDMVTLTHSAASTDPGYSGITIDSVVVTVADNDTAQVTGVVVTSGNAGLLVNWAAVSNATGYKVQWKSGTQSYNTGDRQATITSGSTISHTIAGLTNGTEYTVRVTATRTGANDGPSSDEEMGTPGAPGVTVSKSALMVTEEDTTGDTYTVVLNTQPTASVTVTVAGHAGTDVTLTPSSGTLTFTTANWNTAQTVTVKAGNDADTTNDTVTLTHSAASTDGNYNGVTIGSVVVTVTDNDTARVTGVTVAAGNARLVVNWAAVGNATGYKVQWKSGSQSYNTGNRQFMVTSGSTTSRTITGLTNGTEYTVRVTATRTGASDGLPSAEVMETPEVVTAAGVTVSTMALTVTEQNATGGTYTVVLGTQPTANVMVTVSGYAGTDVTLTPSSGTLTFTTTNWSTAQTVRVRATNDTDTTNDRVTLTHSVTSTDPGYNGIMIGSVVVTVTDNDVVTPPQPVNAPPEFGGSSATRSMDETVGGGAAGTAVKVGAPVTAVDPDGDVIEYSLSGTDRDKFDIDRNTGQLLSRAGERYDHEEKSSYEVRVSASDGEGGTDTIEVAISINNVSEAPEAPGAPRVRASGMTALGISWSAPRNAGRPDITGYDLRYRNTAETDWSDGPRGVEETETEVPGLLEDTEYEVQVRAVNAEGSGEWSEPASGRTGMQPVGIAAAWLGRFGRTVAEHVLSGVSARITALRSSGMKATLGGLDLFPVKSPDELLRGRDDTEEFTNWPGEEEEDSFRFLTLAGHDIRTRSSFALGRSSGGGFGAVWGSGTFGGFNGRESGVSFDGEVRTGMLGADYAVGSLVAGVALSRSVGEGSYRNGRGSGKVKSSVTGVYPYAGNDLSEKFSVWAVAGYGRGEMGVTLPGEGERSSADIDIKMAAAGARGDLVSGANEAGIGVSVEMDTLFVRTTSDGGRGIEATDTDVSRVRLSVEGSVGHAFGGGGMLRPLVEAGIRRDGGDAEAGFGADLGAGLQFSDATGELSMQIRGRTLIVHEAGGFRDWGVSGSIRYDPYPDSPRGLMISLGHSAGGASDGGADALLGRGTLAGLGEGEAVEWNSRLVGEAGYGFGVLGGVFTGTPYVGFGASEGLRDYYLGLRLARMNRDAFDLEFGVEATREESAGAYDPVHGMTFRLALRR